MEVRLRDRNAVLLEILEHAPLPVDLESGVQLERGRAQVALERSLVGVELPVRNQVRRMHERTRAEIALVPSLPGMRPDVNQQIILALEPLMALGTLVRPVRRWHKRNGLVVLEVRQDVLLQLVRAVEGEGTDLAAAFAGGASGSLGTGLGRSGRTVVAAAVRRLGLVVDRG